MPKPRDNRYEYLDELINESRIINNMQDIRLNFIKKCYFIG